MLVNTYRLSFKSPFVAATKEAEYDSTNSLRTILDRRRSHQNVTIPLECQHHDTRKSDPRKFAFLFRQRRSQTSVLVSPV
jgi:hypothetical protein